MHIYTYVHTYTHTHTHILYVCALQGGVATAYTGIKSRFIFQPATFEFHAASAAAGPGHRARGYGPTCLSTG